MTKMHNAVPHNPSIPINNSGGAGMALLITCSSETYWQAWKNVPITVWHIPSNAREVVTTLLRVLSPSLNDLGSDDVDVDSKSAAKLIVATLITIQATPTQWNLYYGLISKRGNSYDCARRRIHTNSFDKTNQVILQYVLLHQRNKYESWSASQKLRNGCIQVLQPYHTKRLCCSVHTCFMSMDVS